ncbi:MULTISPECIES: mandelate racemase/muconate lactonizing enzyme family protein [Natrialbaceae]|uniref:mandelate racemase/muconate lactonizing enzyme family protein n=1 Tax=Natrialbaceae TaxID=1644061 RepID=UPI00207D6F84|nr:mandelate racemase/muconate lactonizing enzyme family protein [Natronococcus sp. CG52]
MSVVIDTVKAIGLTAPPAEPFGYSQEWVTERTSTLVRIEASDGTVGWGECWGPIAGTRETITDFFTPQLEGEDPLAVERIYEDLYEASRAAYMSTIPLPAISGIDIALWDLRGKLLNQSIADLLGGRRRDAVRAYATGHYFKHGHALEEQYDRIAAEAADNAAEFGAVKAKIGLELLGYGHEADIELVRRIRDAIGPDVALFVDANYAYDTATARTVGRALEDMNIGFFEEPVRPQNVDGYVHLRDTLEIPVAGGECHGPRDFERLLENNAVDIAQPDLCNVGGITAANRVAHAAAAAHVQVIPHVWGTPVALAASLQLIATLPGDPWIEFDTSSNPLRDSLSPDPICATDGTVQVPTGPGLGINLDSTAVDQYRVSD